MRRGDCEGAICELLERHGAMIWGICTQVLIRRQDAEDAYQATLLILVKKGHQVRANDSAAGWLYRVALRTALAARRRAAQRREESLELEPIGPAEEPFPDIQRRQTAAILMQELRALPDKYQTPLVLRYLEGQSRRAIAEQTDTTIAAVQGQLARGKKLLRARLVRRGVSLAAAMTIVTASANQACATSAASPLGSAMLSSFPPPFDPALTLSNASTAVSQLAMQGVRSMMFASLVKPVAAVGGVIVVALAAVAAEAEKESLPNVAVAAEAALELQSEAAIESQEATSVTIAEAKPRNEPQQRAVDVSRRSNRGGMRGGGFGMGPGGMGGEQSTGRASGTRRSAGRAHGTPLGNAGTLPVNTAPASSPEKRAESLRFEFVPAESRTNEDIRQEYLAAARKEKEDYAQESYRYIHLMLQHWRTKSEIAKKQLTQASKLAERFAGNPRLHEETYNKQLEAMQHAADAFMAQAKVLEIERQLKRKALGESPLGEGYGWQQPVSTREQALPNPWATGQPLVLPPKKNQTSWQDSNNVTDHVKKIQQALNNRLRESPNLDIDGDYGPLTSAAVKQFQEDNGLRATGAADAATLEKLGVESSPKPGMVYESRTIDNKQVIVGRPLGRSGRATYTETPWPMKPPPVLHPVVPTPPVDVSVPVPPKSVDPRPAVDPDPAKLQDVLSQLKQQLEASRHDFRQVLAQKMQLEMEKKQLETAHKQLEAAKDQLEKSRLLAEIQQKQEQEKQTQQVEIAVGDVLNVEMQIDGGQFNSSSVNKTVTVEPGGTIALGAKYGRVQASGKELAEIEAMIEKQVQRRLQDNADRTGNDVNYKVLVQVTRHRFDLFESQKQRK